MSSRINFKEALHTVAYCLRELDQPHRVEAALWDFWNHHRALNGRDRYARKKAEAYAAQSGSQIWSADKPSIYALRPEKGTETDGQDTET